MSIAILPEPPVIRTQELGEKKLIRGQPKTAIGYEEHKGVIFHSSVLFDYGRLISPSIVSNLSERLRTGNYRSGILYDRKDREDFNEDLALMNIFDGFFDTIGLDYDVETKTRYEKVMKALNVLPRFTKIVGEYERNSHDVALVLECGCKAFLVNSFPINFEKLPSEKIVVIGTLEEIYKFI